MATIEMKVTIKTDLRNQFVICDSLNEALSKQLEMIKKADYTVLKADPVLVIKGMGLIRVFSEALEELLLPISSSIEGGDQEYSEGETAFILGAYELAEEFNKNTKAFKEKLKSIIEEQIEGTNNKNLDELLKDLDIKY